MFELSGRSAGRSNYRTGPSKRSDAGGGRMSEKSYKQNGLV